MKPNSLFVSIILFSFLGAPGCNSREEKPRGAGASGRPLAVLAEAQVDLERFIKYTPEQEKIIQMIHQPFEAAVKPGPGANDPVSKAAVDNVKKSWDEIKYVRNREGRVLRYRVTLDTTIGDLVLDFFEGHAPDVVRNFVARAKAKLFDGRHISLDGDSLVIGESLGKQAYTLPARPLPVPLPKGTLFDFLIDGRAAGDRFGISLKRHPGGGSAVSIFGRVNNANTDMVLGQFAASLTKDPNGIVIKNARVQTFDLPIFEGSAVRLPTLNNKGELEVPDIAMYTNISNPDVDPRKLPTTPRSAADGKESKSLSDPLLNGIPESDTTRSTNPNAPPIKKGGGAPTKNEKEPTKKS